LSYSLILPSSWFGVVRKNVVPGWVMPFEVKERLLPEQSGVAKEEMTSLDTRRGKDRFGLDRPVCFTDWTTHKTDGMGASGAATKGLTPPVDPSESITDVSDDCLAWEQ